GPRLRPAARRGQAPAGGGQAEPLRPPVPHRPRRRPRPDVLRPRVLSPVLKNLTPCPPSLRGKGERRSFSPPRFGEGAGGGGCALLPPCGPCPPYTHRWRPATGTGPDRGTLLMRTHRPSACVFALLLAACPTRADDWKPARGPLLTRWAKDVRPDKVHPEYP